MKMKKIFLILTFLLVLLFPRDTLAMDHKVEIFDPRDERVVKSLPLNDEIWNMIFGWVHAVDEAYPELVPIKDDGFAVKFPVNPPIGSNDLIGGNFINEMYLIAPDSKPPFLIIFTEERFPKVFTFPGDLDEVSEYLDFNLRDF